MGQKSTEVAERFTALNNELISFVENCSDDDWKKICPGEEWTIGVVTRHVADAHYSLADLAKALVAGEVLPEMSMDAIDEMNAKHAKDHAACTKEEVLSMLRSNGSSIAEYIAGLSDDDLTRTAPFSLSGGDISAKQLYSILLHGGKEHLTNMKAALGA